MSELLPRVPHVVRADARRVARQALGHGAGDEAPVRSLLRREAGRLDYDAIDYAARGALESAVALFPGVVSDQLATRAGLSVSPGYANKLARNVAAVPADSGELDKVRSVARRRIALRGVMRRVAVVTAARTQNETQDNASSHRERFSPCFWRSATERGLPNV